MGDKCPDDPASPPLLEVENLSIGFSVPGGFVDVVDSVSFQLRAGEILGVAGESGSGKSVTALSLARLLPSNGSVTGGSIRFQGSDLLQQPLAEVQRLRGKEIGFVFQDPMTSLNPTQQIAKQIGEMARTHLGMNRRESTAHAIELLGNVGIPRPARRASDYPHQFSGGMRQRVMIAMAIACNPSLVIADEPTTALDVTVQAQILRLLQSLSDEYGTAVIMITHDISVAATVCDRINVMYAGQIVESAPTSGIFDASQMPYTRALMRCVPRLSDDPAVKLMPIGGHPPDPAEQHTGCRFRPRCVAARDECHREPPLSARGPDHHARCWGTEAEGWIDAN